MVRVRVRISLRLTLTPTLTLNSDYTTLLISQLYYNIYTLYNGNSDIHRAVFSRTLTFMFDRRSFRCCWLFFLFCCFAHACRLRLMIATLLDSNSCRPSWLQAISFRLGLMTTTNATVTITTRFDCSSAALRPSTYERPSNYRRIVVVATAYVWAKD